MSAPAPQRPPSRDRRPDGPGTARAVRLPLLGVALVGGAAAGAVGFGVLVALPGFPLGRAAVAAVAMTALGAVVTLLAAHRADPVQWPPPVAPGPGGTWAGVSLRAAALRRARGRAAAGADSQPDDPRSTDPRSTDPGDGPGGHP